MKHSEKKLPITYWVKYLSDGTKEVGTPEKINRGEASWTKGRKDIISVLLVYGGTSIRLEGDINCPFFQFDNKVSSMGPSTLLSRDVGCVLPKGYKISTYLKAKQPTVVVGRNAKVELPAGSKGITCSISFDGEITVKHF